jgi:hypothetical protein
VHLSLAACQKEKAREGRKTESEKNIDLYSKLLVVWMCIAVLNLIYHPFPRHFLLPPSNFFSPLFFSRTRPYAFSRSHMHTGPLVIAIATPSLWLTRPRD